MSSPKNSDASGGFIERRAHARTINKVKGFVNFDDLSSAECTVENYSDHGACLSLESHERDRSPYELHAPKLRLLRRISVVWRRRSKMGVQFVS